jgi:hypothetical protein
MEVNGTGRALGACIAKASSQRPWAHLYATAPGEEDSVEVRVHEPGQMVPQDFHQVQRKMQDRGGQLVT